MSGTEKFPHTKVLVKQISALTKHLSEPEFFDQVRSELQYFENWSLGRWEKARGRLLDAMGRELDEKEWCEQYRKIPLILLEAQQLGLVQQLGKLAKAKENKENAAKAVAAMLGGLRRARLELVEVCDRVKKDITVPMGMEEFDEEEESDLPARGDESG
ncbi:hypothetical protein BU23DRAFT_575413 [Bimuria novae-zelandiae CBS 107.79]|uniref:Uncharacterized protein n=1 Tax=Bimuria novae-zelandiae CBS 107.79 TaxID=1447943 RepID=A0A6A5ULF6_9PLEO|nr:hypothetical protein BU23DRAFT_575413 [Bimuria novae-zelandiae CBS 107.79]